MQTKKKNSAFLALSVAAALWSMGATHSQAADRKPNIILIVAEDATNASSPGKSISTPNIESLTKSGITFSSAYSVSSEQGPSDAALLTGQYPQRFGFDINADGTPAPADHGPRGLDAAQLTVARDLKSAGYATGAFGSWTLGSSDGYQPAQRGFDESDVADPASRASAFIESHAASPFFLYLPVNSATAEDVVGKVSATLQNHQLDENTLIVIADNRHAARWSLAERGIKSHLTFIWKNTITPGQTIDQPLSQLDVAPTVLEAAGVETHSNVHLDGTNLLPFLQSQVKALPGEILYWRLGPQYAVRQGDWKLAKLTAEGRPQLFYLENPIIADVDLFKQQGQQSKNLQTLWDAWNAGNQPARWADLRWNGQPSGDGGSSDSTSASAKNAGPWKSGDSLTTKQAPNIAGKALEISADIDLSGENGVIIAQGGAGNGYAIYLADGKPSFATRVDGDLTVIASKEKLGPGHFIITASLGHDGALLLAVDHKTVAQGKAQSVIQKQPKAGLRVGDTGNGTVGEYPSPDPFQGKISNVNIAFK